MAELACLTGRPGGAKEVLPALEYLAHPVATLPLDTDSLPAAAAKELVVVDATRDLSRAQSLCRILRGSAEHLAILDELGDRFGDRFVAVLGYSSVLVDGRRWPDPAAPVPDGAELALLPPFSGGA